MQVRIVGFSTVNVFYPGLYVCFGLVWFMIVLPEFKVQRNSLLESSTSDSMACIVWGWTQSVVGSGLAFNEMCWKVQWHRGMAGCFTHHKPQMQTPVSSMFSEVDEGKIHRKQEHGFPVPDVWSRIWSGTRFMTFRPSFQTRSATNAMPRASETTCQGTDPGELLQHCQMQILC